MYSAVTFYSVGTLGEPIEIRHSEPDHLSPDYFLRHQSVRQSRYSKIHLGAELIPPPLDLDVYNAVRGRPPIGHLFRFYTSTACLPVAMVAQSLNEDDHSSEDGEQRDADGVCEFNIEIELILRIVDREAYPPRLKLDIQWRQTQPRLLDFVFIGDIASLPNFLLIKFIDRLVYRRSQLEIDSTAIGSDIWEAANPEWRLIIMA
jgi:hypothetical protein